MHNRYLCFSLNSKSEYINYNFKHLNNHFILFYLILIKETLKKKLKVNECSVGIKSIEIQLVRVETCGCAEGYSKDLTEIQNVQIGEGDVLVYPFLFI